jgi:hypothetical protein
MPATRRRAYVEGASAIKVWDRLVARRGFKTEAAFQKEVVKIARANGWRVYYHVMPFHSPKGWPDLTLIHAGRRLLRYRELKMPGEIPTPEQVECLALLRLTGADADMLYPADLEAFTAFLVGA